MRAPLFSWFGGRGHTRWAIRNADAVTAGAQAATAPAMTSLCQGKGIRPGTNIRLSAIYSYLSAWIGLARATLTAWPTTVAIAIPSAIAAASTKGIGVRAIR